VIDRAVVEAEARAAAIVARAEAEAARIVGEASAKAASAREDAEREGRAAAVAKLAAAWMRLRDEEASTAARAEQQTIEIARVLAERLLGQALVLEPSLVVALARQALSAVSRARRVTVAAHPDDAEALRTRLGELGMDGAVIDVVVDASRSRGGLRIESDLGTLDADLAPQLDRLVAALR
jgi:flagellar biosynthesis/type III secretory pathway protein FliH